MKKVIFACVENKKRSQIAEAIFNHLAKNAIAESAGTMPAETAHPLVEHVLTEIKIPWEPKMPRKVTDDMLEEADFIVSFGCLVPSMFPKDKFEEWFVSDPKTTDEHRQTRDEIFEKVEDFIARHNL